VTHRAAAAASRAAGVPAGGGAAGDGFGLGKGELAGNPADRCDIVVVAARLTLAVGGPSRPPVAGAPVSFDELLPMSPQRE